ncbi:MAG: MATE family efflux transporter [Rhodospirillales bacterium]|nr:MATE family efflux transporter [Alphaproteobacteria bacterium]MCB9977070.1 MATE family efflux transporter [Rhodospirillales bacterium]
MKNKPLPHSLKGNLTEGPVLKHLIRLTLPMIWGIAAIISFQLVDTYFISQLGTAELAAISFTFPLTYLIFSFTMGFGIAMSSVASRLIGEGRREDVRRIATHGLILSLIVAAIITGLGMLFHDMIFRLQGASPETIALIRQYMMIWFAGNLCLTIPLVGNSAIRATGDTFTPAVIMSIAAFSNIILDPIMIFGWFGFPAMGIKGAALATIFGNSGAMIAGLYVMSRRKNLLLSLNDLHLDRFKDSMKRLLTIALPVGLTNAITPAVNFAIVGLLSKYGEEAVAAFGVASRIEAFAFVILMALSVGMAPIIGQNWGAGRTERTVETLRLTISFNIVWSLFIAVILMTFAAPVAGLFSDDPAVIGYAVIFFWSVPVTYTFSNLINGWGSAFNAIGKPQRTFMMIVLKMVVLTLPCVWLGSKVLGVRGVFLGIATVNLAAGLTFHLWSWNTFTRRDQADRLAASAS